MTILALSFFGSIIFILAGNEMHESLDEFKFWPETTTNSKAICPCASEKLMYNVVNTLALTFSIGSSSFLQVTRTTIKSRTTSKFGQIGQWTVEVASLERLKKFGQIGPRTAELAALERLEKILIDL